VKYWYAGFGALATALALAACGGGGGGGGNPIPPHGGGSPTPTPASAMYSGSENVVTVYSSYPPSNSSDPNVTPYPNTNVTYGLSDKVSETKMTTTVNETVTEPNETLTATVTTSSTSEPTAGSETNIAETKTQYSDSDSYSQAVAYPTPLIVDQEPETNGANWTNTAERDTSETYSDGTQIARTANADGSYSEQEINTNQSISDTATVNSDASGTWVANEEGFISGLFSEYAFTAPSGGNVTFTATETTAGCNQTGPPCTQSLTAPVFFSTNPLLLWSNSSTIATSVTFPAACNVPASDGTTGNDIHTVQSDVDPLFGFTEDTTTDAYTSTDGLVCVQSTDILKTYYDWNLDSAYFLVVSNSAKPFITTTTTQTLTLQTGNGIGILSKSTSPASATASNAAMADAAVLARTMTRGEAIRRVAEERSAVLRRLFSHGAHGVKR
jgi:hypothetical protein